MLLLCYARVLRIRGAGSRFRIGCFTVVGLYLLACIALPGERQLDDVVSGTLLLATAILLVYVFWSLLAWGFTLTLLTASRNEEKRPASPWRAGLSYDAR